MKKIIFLLVSFLLIVSVGFSGATTYVEDFENENPFSSWETRWLGSNSDLQNVYGVGQGRGNNPDGLWIGSQTIIFNSNFGLTLTSLSFDVASWVSHTVSVYDSSDSMIYQSALMQPNNGAYTDPGTYDNHFITSQNGISRIFFDGVSILGNTSIDNVIASDSGQNSVPEPATMILFGLGLLGLAGVNRKK